MSRAAEAGIADQSVRSLAEARSSRSTLAHLLRWRGAHQTDRLAYRFLLDGAEREAHMTYGALDRRARAVAARLRRLGERGDRALLVYPPGLDFIAALFGCWYAGMIAVPTYPPRRGRTDQTTLRLARTVTDAEPIVALTSTSMLDAFEEASGAFPVLRAVRRVYTDQDEGHVEPEFGDPSIDGPVAEDVALLQYTSGSTAAPRGVAVTHGNLMHNLAAIEAGFESSPKTVAVAWLPPYHDMGLVGGILKPAFVGFPIALMSPLHFLQRPYRWLRAISRLEATISGGPDFGFELCVQKVKPEQRVELDLSRWSVAFDGAEPVRPETLDRFADFFAPCGFRREAFYPCYGLAESTLMVTGGKRGRAPVVRRFRMMAAGKVAGGTEGDARARTLVGCGTSIGGQEVAISHPETGVRLGADTIGEIRVAGPSVAARYWNRADESDRVFGTPLLGESRPHLRTGDLGFLDGDELFVVGRLKDLVIIDGLNHHPEDIERTVAESHDAVPVGGCAAFSVDEGDGERLVVLLEPTRRPAPDPDEIATAVRAAISGRHDVRVHDVVSLVDVRLPRTSSGKVQRHACRRLYLDSLPKSGGANP